MNQQEAALSIGVGYASVARWETGSHAPRGLNLRAVEAWIAETAKKGRKPHAS
jgi:DNA-binding transcriptional regulator YiaG